LSDNVDHPKHYKDVIPGIEAIDVTKHFNFCRGNAIKYIWRAAVKGNEVEDLQKAIWYLQCELESLGVPRGDSASAVTKVVDDITRHPDYQVMRVHKEAAEYRLEAITAALEGVVEALTGDIEV
jgi:hypothetical protein